MAAAVPELAKDATDLSRIEEVPVSARVRCPRCGTLRQPRDASACRACGEPAVVWSPAP